jgi:hypothetical protein
VDTSRVRHFPTLLSFDSRTGIACYARRCSIPSENADSRSKRE